MTIRLPIVLQAKGVGMFDQLLRLEVCELLRNVNIVHFLAMLRENERK